MVALYPLYVADTIYIGLKLIVVCSYVVHVYIHLLL